MLHQSEERYRSIFESTTSLIISVDEEGTIVDCNARMKHTLDYTLNETIGRNLLDFVSPDEHTKVSESLEDALTTVFKYTSELKMAQKDEGLIVINIKLAAVREANNDYVRTICMIEEVIQPLRR